MVCGIDLLLGLFPDGWSSIVATTRTRTMLWLGNKDHDESTTTTTRTVTTLPALTDMCVVGPARRAESRSCPGFCYS